MLEAAFGEQTKFLVVFQDCKWWDLCWGG